MITRIKLAIAVIFVVSATIKGQSADTLKIHLTYKHKLTDAGQTKGYITINQKIFTPNDTLIREVSYEETSGQLKDYIFYFYRDGKLFTKEYYDHVDSLQYIDKYDYNENDSITQITRLQPKNGDLHIIQRTVNTYGPDGRINKIKKYFGKKAGITITFSYDQTGLLLERVSKFKAVAKDTLKKLSESYVYLYGVGNTLSALHVQGKTVNNNTFNYTDSISYTDNGRIANIKKTDDQNKTIEEIRYSYLRSGALSIYEAKDEEGIIRLLLQFDYKKHYMDKGTQVSRYENF